LWRLCSCISFALLQPRSSRITAQPRCLPDDGPDVGGGVLDHYADILARTELEANLNAAGALERYQILPDKLARLLHKQRLEASHDRHQPQSPSDYRQSSERGRARACKNQSPRRKNGLAGNPTITARRHYILCLEAVRRHRSC